MEHLFDPLLSAIVSDSERNTLLKWFNEQAEDNLLRPDASITLIDQLQFGAHPGFGEVKIVQPTYDKAALYSDFLHLTHLTNNHLLDVSFSFQTYGFSVAIYVTRMDHHKIYTMTELGRIQFPRSLNDISTAFQNMQVLVQITNDFWTPLQAQSLSCNGYRKVNKVCQH